MQMKVPRAFKGKRTTNTAEIIMALEIVLKFLSNFEMSSLPMFKTIRGAGRGGNKVTK
jgi:hypothetical protein